MRAPRRALAPALASSLAPALALALAVLLPQAALACFGMKDDLWLCAAGSDWDGAVPDRYGDGTDLVLPDARLVVDFAYYGRSDGPLAADLDRLHDWFTEEDSAAPLLRDRIALGAIEAERVIAAGAPDLPGPVARMVVQFGDHRFAMSVIGAETVTPDRIDALSRAAVQALRSVCDGPETCARDAA